MNNAVNHGCLPPLIANVLHDPLTHVDNLFADTWKQLRFGSLIHKAGFRKRRGSDIIEAVFLLLLWRWVNVSSICVFASKAIGVFSHARKDVLYDTLKREDINWREFNLQVAKRIYKPWCCMECRVQKLLEQGEFNL